MRYWRAAAGAVVLGVVSLLPDLPLVPSMLRTGAIMAGVLLVMELVHRRRGNLRRQS
jgi:hypothetical protein